MIHGLPCAGVVVCGIEVAEVLWSVDLMPAGTDAALPICHADEWEVLRVRFGGTFIHCEVHVGLAGGEPDFADE